VKAETIKPTNPIASEADATSPASGTCATAEKRPSSGTRRRDSIRRRLAFLVLACVLPVWIAAGVLVYKNYQSQRALTEQHMLDTARALTMVVDRELVSMQAGLSVLATSPSLATGDLPAFYRQARVVLEAHSGFDIILADATGQQLVNTFLPYGAPLPKRSIPDAVHQVYATGKPMITNVFKGARTGRYLISVDVPVFGNGRVVYDLAMTVPTDRFANVLLQQQLQPGWLGRIYDSDQVQIARTRLAEKFVGRPSPGVLGQQMRNTAEGTVESTNFEGVSMFNSFSRSATSGWTVVIGVPKAAMMAEIWHRLWWVIAGTALLSLAGIALALFIARRIAGSIQDLIAPALALGRGEAVMIGHFELAETDQVGESLLKAAQLIQQRAAERERAEAARREAEELKLFNAELERSEAEAHARATELAAILDAVPVFTLIAHEPECRRITSNRAGYDLLHLPPGTNISTSAPQSDRTSHFRFLRDGKELSPHELPVQLAAATGREVRDCEYTIAFDDGSSRIIFGNAVPLLDNTGKVRGAVGAFVDITERKRAEKQLQATAERLQAVLENAPVGITINDRERGLIEPNAAYQRICGYSAEELKGKKFTDYTHPDDVARNLHLYEQLHNRELQSYELEKRYIRKDGETRWVRVIASRINEETNIGIIEDITDRKQAEQQLRATANHLQAILDNAPVGIVTGNRQHRFEETNAAFQRMTGYSGEELKQMDWKVLTHPDDVAMSMDLVGRFIPGQPNNYDFEKRYVLKDGKTIWVRIIGTPLDEERKIAIIEDITEQKNADRQLRRSETRLRRLMDSDIVGVVIAGPDGAILETNKAFLDMVGYAEEDFKKGLSWRDLTSPEYAALDDAALKMASETGAFRPYEKELLRKNGTRVPVIVGGARTEEGEAIVFALDLTELKKAQLELEQLARIVESADDAIISLSLEGTIMSWNNGAERLYGYSQEEMIGASDDILLPADGKSEWEAFREAVGSGKRLERFRRVRITKTGEAKPVGLTISPIRDENDRVIGISTITRDRTQTVRNEQLEEQLRQAQKLESLGRLAGGIAHDFNNHLMVIRSYTEMLQDSLPADDIRRKRTQAVMKAADRAASLTRQMLAFSRKQVLSPVVLDIRSVINETARMLKRLIGEDIELQVSPAAESLWAIEADPDQIVQVLMNLCVNARDAMPQGGTLTIATGNVTVHKASVARPYLLPGDYVLLSVTDTGTGISRDVLGRIFEPFFTTKEVGKGTGLGLATVYGIVKQSGGYVWVDSEVGRGSCFTIYLPRVKRAVAPDLPAKAEACPRGDETILVAEDEDALREATCTYLRSFGYTVIAASSGQHALAMASAYEGTIDLLLTDLVMPGTGGEKLAQALGKLRPGLKTIFMSGYSDEAALRHGFQEQGAAFLQKPFSLSTLARKLRDTLGQMKTVP
jgi:PAS domain S-box-containing protein